MCIRNREGGEWGNRRFLHLSSLALYAGLCPTSNIRIDTRPDETRSDQLLSGSDTWVGEVVKRFKHDVTSRFWHDGSLCACGSVTVERVR